jgi:hypothetical protein
VKEWNSHDQAHHYAVGIMHIAEKIDKLGKWPAWKSHGLVEAGKAHSSSLSGWLNRCRGHRAVTTS